MDGTSLVKQGIRGSLQVQLPAHLWYMVHKAVFAPQTLHGLFIASLDLWSLERQ